MNYKIEGEVAVEVNINAADPDEALEKFYELLDENEKVAYEVNRYRVYEL